jgi:hypothetical protein
MPASAISRDVGKLHQIQAREMHSANAGLGVEDVDSKGN